MGKRSLHQRLLEHHPDGIVAFLGGEIEYLNPSALSMLGLASPCSLSKLKEMLHPDSKMVWSSACERWARGEEAPRFRCRWIRNDQTEVEIDIISQSLTAQDKLGVLLLWRAQNAAEFLFRTTPSQTLRDVDRRLQEFAHIASHDMQEPIRKVFSFAERLLAKFGDEMGPKGTMYVERIIGAADRMQRLLGGLLSYSRVETQGRMFVAADLNKIVQRVWRGFAEEAKMLNAELSYDLLPMMECDEVQIEQLIRLLIDNALKFRRPAVPPHIQISSRDDGTRVKLCIKDNGLGVAEKDAGRIFEPFQRLHGRHEYEGTGMGLAIGRRIVERHGGSIEVQGKPGAGTKFCITFPARLSLKRRRN